jgi:RNase P subunit RPR2
VLKLIYHTAVFGPIDLEFDRPVISVGRSEDNDLVLRHPSILPHHCLLVFRGERLFCLPPRQPIPTPNELPNLTGPELGPADSLQIGELQFTLASSARTVALPDQSQGSVNDAAESSATGGIEGGTGQRRYYCAYCRTFVPDAEVKRVGLVGHVKRDLCPKCSRLLATEPGAAEPSLVLKKCLPKSRLSRVFGNMQARIGGTNS